MGMLFVKNKIRAEEGAFFYVDGIYYFLYIIFCRFGIVKSTKSVILLSIDYETFTEKHILLF